MVQAVFRWNTLPGQKPTARRGAGGFLIDVLKLASLNTPDSLSSSFSMLGALILGDFAVQAGWLGPEVLVYMASKRQ